MLKRFVQVTVLALVLGVAPMVALRGVSYASGSVDWTGQGADSVKACSTDQTPFLHWIFTTGGNSDISAATLTVGGDASGGGAMSPHSAQDHGSWTLTTSYSGTSAPTTSTVTASVAYTGSLGEGNSNLVISDGCFGSEGGGEQTDVCVNIDGIQTEVPAGMVADDEDNCTTPTTPGTGGQGGGQVLGSSTTASVSVTPQGGVAAGAGGALNFGSL
jgi:hypothetical protein